MFVDLLLSTLAGLQGFCTVAVREPLSDVYRSCTPLLSFVVGKFEGIAPALIKCVFKVFSVVFTAGGVMGVHFELGGFVISSLGRF